MLTLGTVLLVATITFVLWLINDWLLRPRQAPAGLRPLPGPLGLPLIGCLPLLGTKPHVALMKYADQYGPIFKLRIGFRTVIVLSSTDVMKDTLAKDPAFAGRPDFATLQTFAATGGQSRFAFRTGNATWRFLRKMSTRALALFATSRNSRLQVVVNDAFATMNKELEEKNGDAEFDPTLTIGNAIGTTIGTVLFGKGVDARSIVQLDADNKQHFQDVAPTVQNVLSFGVLDYFPGIGMEYFMRDKLDRLVEALEPVNVFTEQEIIKHENQLNRDGKVEDVADALAEAADETDPKMMAELGIDKDKIKFISQDLFGAGLNTTTEMMKWSVNILAAHPEVQKKAQQELDEEMQGEPVTFEHLDKLPYNHALQLEILRLVTMVPLGVPHSIMHNTSYDDYYIPANAVVFHNMYAHNYHPNVFFRPSECLPERFLTDSGVIDPKEAEKVTVFGVGKRRCVGENLAKQELFMFLSRTLQNFDIVPAPGVKINILESNVGFIRGALPYKLLFKKRV